MAYGCRRANVPFRSEFIGIEFGDSDDIAVLVEFELSIARRSTHDALEEQRRGWWGKGRVLQYDTLSIECAAAGAFEITSSTC